MSITTWVVLALCLAIGIGAVAVTAVVVVRLNRQILASAAELRAGLATPTESPNDILRRELIAYAAEQSAIETHWAQSMADFQLRYPENPVYRSVATAEVVQAIKGMRRPPIVAALHERWAQAWSDRDAALATIARAGATPADQARASDQARRADDELRRVRNELHDLYVANGIFEGVAVLTPTP